MNDETRAAFQELSRQLNARFDAVDQRFAAMDRRLDGIDQRLGAVDQRLDTVDRRLDAVDQRLDTVDRRLDAVDQRLDVVEQRVASEAAETRRQFGVMTEWLRREIKLLVDGLEINRRHVTTLHEDMRAEFAARDAVLRAAFVDVRRDIAALRERPP